MPKGIYKRKAKTATLAKKTESKRSRRIRFPSERMLLFTVPVQIPYSVVLKAFYEGMTGHVPKDWENS